MIEQMKQALEALERSVATCFDQYAHQQVMSQPDHFINQAITAIKEALRENAMREVQRLGQEIEQEPVAWMQVTKYGNKLLAFTEPPLEPPCYTGEFIAAKNYPLFLKKENT